MLGIITRPFVVKGEYAKAVRKAALESYRSLKTSKSLKGVIILNGNNNSRGNVCGLDFPLSRNFSPP